VFLQRTQLELVMQRFYESLGKLALFAAIVGGSIYLKSGSQPKPSHITLPTFNLANSYKPFDLIKPAATNPLSPEYKSLLGE
jgi:hypothetical protein